MDNANDGYLWSKALQGYVFSSAVIVKMDDAIVHGLLASRGLVEDGCSLQTMALTRDMSDNLVQLVGRMCSSAESNWSVSHAVSVAWYCRSRCQLTEEDYQYLIWCVRRLLTCRGIVS